MRLDAEYFSQCVQSQNHKNLSAGQKAIRCVFYWSAEENLLLRTGKRFPTHSNIWLSRHTVLGTSPKSCKSFCRKLVRFSNYLYLCDANSENDIE